MKKYLSLILVMALLSSMLCMGVSAVLTVPADTEVSVFLNLNGEVIHNYSVDIEYDQLIFTFTASNFEWTVNSENESYSYEHSNGDWAENSKTLKITNHSDLALKYTVTMNQASKYDGLNFNLEDATKTLPACTVGTPFGSNNGTVKISVNGSVPGDAVDGEQMGALTVEFDAVP